MQMLTINLEKILKEFSITELEDIVFKSTKSKEHFLNLAEIETTEYDKDLYRDSKYQI